MSTLINTLAEGLVITDDLHPAHAANRASLAVRLVREASRQRGGRIQIGSPWPKMFFLWPETVRGVLESDTAVSHLADILGVAAPSLATRRLALEIADALSEDVVR